MGAWGILAFDNDDANDWAYDLEEVDDLSLIESTFDAVEEADGYLESPEACNALAACEVLARLNGNAGYKNSYTEKVDNWVAAHPIRPPAAIIARANAAIDRILGDNSELRELWNDSDHNAEWLASVAELPRGYLLSRRRQFPGSCHRQPTSSLLSGRRLIAIFHDARGLERISRIWRWQRGANFTNIALLDGRLSPVAFSSPVSSPRLS